MELRCEKISKAFGHVTALKDIEITVKAGEIRALLGGNGSGKSTLAKIIGGIYYPDEGKVVFGNEDYTKTTPGRQKKRGVIITSQELSLFTNLTVAENLNITELPRKGFFIDKKAMSDRAFEVLEKINMKDVMDKKVSALAPNQLYLLEFAKALLQKPKILVVDEITSALFRDDVVMIKELLDELKEKGVVILFISHRMNEIYSICDSVTVMRNGETVGTFGIGEKEETELLSMMVGKSIDELTEAEKTTGSRKESDEDSMVRLKDFKLPGFGTKLNLDIKRGEIVGIAGLQGHGQSELTRAVMGLYGEADVELCGEAVCITSPADAVKKGIAFVSGDRIKDGAFLERSVTENTIAVTNIALNSEKVEEEKLLKRIGVKYGTLRQQIQELSGGNQQKVIVGRWICAKPKILLADDPTKGIDVQARRDLHRIFCEMAEEGASILMFSSDDEELVSMTHMAKKSRVLVMYEGTIAAQLEGQDITVHNIIEHSLQKKGGVN